MNEKVKHEFLSIIDYIKDCVFEECIVGDSEFEYEYDKEIFVIKFKFEIEWETCNHIAWDDEVDWDYTGVMKKCTCVGATVTYEDGTESDIPADLIKIFNMSKYERDLL